MAGPISLTDTELTAVFDAARPLAVGHRNAFLRAVADALASCNEIGPGTVHRVCADQQRKFFDPPTLNDDEERYRRRWRNSKYG
jgi:hypothetical protein